DRIAGGDIPADCHHRYASFSSASPANRGVASNRLQASEPRRAGKLQPVAAAPVAAGIALEALEKHAQVRVFNVGPLHLASDAPILRLAPTRLHIVEILKRL